MKKPSLSEEDLRFFEMLEIEEESWKEIDEEVRQEQTKNSASNFIILIFSFLFFLIIFLYVYFGVYFIDIIYNFLELWFMKAVIIAGPTSIMGILAQRREKKKRTKFWNRARQLCKKWNDYECIEIN